MALSRRGPKTWEIRWELGRDSQGKRLQKSHTFHGSKEEALRYYIQKEAEYRQGIGLTAGDLTIAHLSERWLTDAKAPTVELATLGQYQHAAKRFIVPTLGHILLEDLSPLHVQRALREWQTMLRLSGPPGPVSRRTVRIAYGTLAMMIQQAVQWQLISRNVVLLVDPPKVPKRPDTWWTAEEAAHFLVASQDYLHGMVFVLGLLTGLRLGELLGVRWRDIDWDAGTLTVRQVWTKHKTFKAPKTHRGVRPLKLDPEVLDLLKVHQTAQKRQRVLIGGAYEDYDLICCTGTGKPLLHRNVQRDFDKLVVKTGLPDIRFHDMRHTNASIMRDQGIDFRIIADRLGHAQVAFTIQTYTHAKTDQQADAASKLSGALLTPRKPRRQDPAP